MSYHNYVCSCCGAKAYYDGRYGDGPVLMCECVSPENSWSVPDRFGTWDGNYCNAEPVSPHEYHRRHGGIHGKKPSPGPSGLS